MQSSRFAGLFKSLRFAVIAALGCLIAAILGEAVLALTLPKDAARPARAKVDVLFLLDVTGSMQDEIRGVQTSIQRFVSEFSARDLDARVGLIAFRDRTEGEEMEALTFGGEAFTTDTASFSDKVGSLRADGGGDGPESALDALQAAANAPFREEAVKVVLLISDAPPKVPDLSVESADQAAGLLLQRGIDQLHLVVQQEDSYAWSDLHSMIPGQVFPLAESAAARSGFGSVLPEFGSDIAESIQTGSLVQGDVTTSAERSGALLVATGLWTGVLAIGVILSLVMGQNRYLRRPLVEPGQVFAAVAGGLAAGALAGGAGQVLYGGSAMLLSGFPDLLPLMMAGVRLVSWTLLGALLGWGTSRFIPNLRGGLAVLGGMIGGFCGAAGFVVTNGVLGLFAGGAAEVPARILGAVILGFFIGLMIVLAEAAFRKAWLEVEYEPGQVSLVNLGHDPVTVGSDRRLSMIALYGLSSIQGTYRFQDGRITYEDYETKRVEPVEPGSAKAFGAVKVRARASG